MSKPKKAALNQTRPADQTKQINITIGLLEMTCSYFQFTEYAMINKKPIAFEGYEFQFTINFNLIESAKQARVTVDSKLYEKQGDNIKFELAEIKLLGVFTVLNYDQIILKDKTNSNILIPNSLMELCNNICISSLRGMYSVKLENSLYSNAILPLLDPKMFVPKQIIKT